MSTSQKHADFVRETMRDKPVQAVVGIGDGAAAILDRIGVDKAYHILGQYLILNKDEIVFNEWLKSQVSIMTAKHRGDCIECLREWCEHNL